MALTFSSFRYMQIPVFALFCMKTDVYLFETKICVNERRHQALKIHLASLEMKPKKKNVSRSSHYYIEWKRTHPHIACILYPHNYATRLIAPLEAERKNGILSMHVII